jgi:hypothetical protein
MDTNELNQVQKTNSFVLRSIPDELTPFGRMMALLEWYLSSFHMGRTDSAAKKPYNPIIGETFHCSWRVQNTNPSLKEHTSLKPKYVYETVNLGPQSRSQSATENIATDTNVHPTSDGHTSGQHSTLANESETQISPLDATTQDEVDEIYAVKDTSASSMSAEIVKDVIKKNHVITDTSIESIEVTYTAEQVSHHPPGMLLYNSKT